MEHTLSVYRHEIKYLISKQDTQALSLRLDKLLERDTHALSDSYIVRSLYFDSINNRDYATKLAGTQIRRKIRLRIYSADARKAKLEVKHKNGNLQHKVSLWISREDAKALCQGDYSILIPYFSISQDAAAIYTMMTSGCYRPVVLVEYDRLAYTYPLFSTRITFDTNVRSSEGNLDLFYKKPVYQMLLNQQDIMEVKYNQQLVKFLSDIFRQFHLTQTSVSKYCIGRKVFCDFNY